MNSVNVAPPGSLRVLCSLPLDLGLAVLKQCSPMDLVNLAMSCKVYRRVIFAHPNLWDLAYDNLARGTCPRLPSRPRVEASGNYWEEAYVLWIFGGGPCSYCSKITATVPFHFLFRFRACSSKCQRKLSSYWKNRVYKGSLAMADTFPFNKGLPHLRNQLNIQVPFAAIERAYDEVVAADEFEEEDLDADDDTPFKIRSREELEEEYVLRERSRPAIEKNAEDLQVWRAAYLQEMNSAAGSNLALVKLMLKEHALEERAAMACPRVKQLLGAFNRDLEHLTINVWAENLDIIRHEAEFVSPERKVACSLCGRVLTAERIEDHRRSCRSKMTSQDHRKRKCRRCSNSRRRYTRRELKDHHKSVHGT